MNNNIRSHIEEIRLINCFANELDALYHHASVRMGISDSVSIILYTVYDMGNECLLSEIYKMIGISKQTINSSVRKLEADGILYLEKHDGRTKKVVLTEKGKEYARNTIAKLLCAETEAFDTWSEDEIKSYVSLTRKHLQCLRREIEKL